jgi:flagellar hook assembly protein FlgD
LSDAVPNPFNPSTTITYSIPRDMQVSLEIFDVAGRHVTSLVRGHVVAGEHQAQWAGRDDGGHRVASGVYLYRLQAADQVKTKRMVLIK